MGDWYHNHDCVGSRDGSSISNQLEDAELIMGFPCAGRAAWQCHEAVFTRRTFFWGKKSRGISI